MILALAPVTNHSLGQGHHGRLWDSPMTDDLPKVDMTGATCVLREELVDEADHAVRLLQDYHLACLLRSILGDVYHHIEECQCVDSDVQNVPTATMTFVE